MTFNESCSKPLTSIELRLNNLQRVSDYLYQAREASRLEISTHTGLSLPTISASIHELEERNLAINIGMKKSTGGRRAQAYRFNNIAYIAIGVEILKESVQLVATDLYGTIIKEDNFSVVFDNTDGYFQLLGLRINQFSDDLKIGKEQILGVGIALQGLISDDGDTITYSEILKCTGTKRSRFQQYINIPCVLIHDTEAAAMAEIWHEGDISNAIYFALNRNFGGTLILNGRIPKSVELSSSVIEHMCLDPHGPLCYCGKHGCIETFCSANHLREKSKLEMPEFFNRLHKGDIRCTEIWNEFLQYLALGIDNIRMVLNCDFIIGGYLVQFMNDNDFQLLSENIQQQSFLKNSSFLMKKSRYAEKSPKIGAALLLIDFFLSDIFSENSFPR